MFGSVAFWVLPSFESRASQTVQSGVQAPPGPGPLPCVHRGGAGGNMVMGRVALPPGVVEVAKLPGGGRNANVSVSL